MVAPSTQADSARSLAAESSTPRRNEARTATGRSWPWHRVSLLWRVFGANVIVFVVAVVLLAWTPVTVHRVATPGELVILVLGLLLMLVFDLVLLHRAFGPLRRLTAVMREVEPGQPGRRADFSERSGSEVAELARALNAMLDRLEGERRESGRRALAAQEGERKRVARELHDEVGQVLTAIALRAERASQDATNQPEALAEITRNLTRSLEDLQRIGRELRPEALDDLGLVNSLIALCSRIDREAGLRVQRDLEWNLPALSADEELVIYRIAQEALTNALRHAKATRVTVTLKYVDADVVLTVCDDGCGLPAQRTESGLVGMRERAMLIDAHLDIQSAVGEGTRITLSVPATAA